MIGGFSQPQCQWPNWTAYTGALIPCSSRARYSQSTHPKLPRPAPFLSCPSLWTTSLTHKQNLLVRYTTGTGEGNGNPLQYSCLENPTDRGAWRATVHGVAKSQTRLSTYTQVRNSNIFSTTNGSATILDTFRTTFPGKLPKWKLYFLNIRE